VDDAEAALGITVESYIDGSPDASTSTTSTSTFEDELKLSPSLAGKLSALTPNQLIDLIFESLALLKPHVDLAQLFIKFLDKVCVDALCILEDLYAWLAKKNGCVIISAWLYPAITSSHEKIGGQWQKQFGCQVLSVPGQ